MWVEFKLWANADDEELHYEWLGMVWGLSPDDPVGFPSLMVWIPTLGAWRSFRIEALSHEGDRGDSVKATSLDDLQSGEHDGAILELGLTYDQDVPTLGDMLDLKDGEAVASPQTWCN